MNRKIIELREVVTKLVPLLTQRGLTVTQRGSQAYVRANARTGKPEVVNIPNIPDTASDDFVLAVHGFIDHEVAHVLHTDFTVRSSKYPAGSEGFKRIDNLHNIIEDTMIERLIVETFPGSRKNLSNVLTYFLKNVTNKALAATSNQKDQFAYLIVPMMRALSGQPEAQDWMDRHKHWDHPAVKDLHDRLPQAFFDGIKVARSSHDTLALTEILDDVLYGDPPKEEEEEEKKGNSQDKPDKEAGQGDGDGERDHSNSEENDEDALDEAGGSSSKQDEADEEEEGEKSSNKKPQSEEGESEDDGDGGDSKSGEVSEEESEDEGDESEEEDDQSDTDEGDTDEGDAGGEAGSQGDQKGGQSSPSDSGDAEMEAEDQSEDPGAPESGSGDENQGTAGGGIGTSAAKSMFDYESDFFEKVDMSSEIARKISEEAVDVISSSSYTAFTREADRIEPVRLPDVVKDGWVSEMDDEVRTMTGVMQKDIERIMASQSHVIRTPGHRRGKLHAPSLYRVMQGDPRVFSQLQEHKSKDTAVTLLCDNSGSMGGMKMKLAMISAYALCQTLDRVKISNEVLGFTTGSFFGMPSSLNAAMREEYSKSHVSYDRTCPIVMPIYKTFEERISSTVKQRFAYMMNAQPGLNGNIDGESIQMASERLIKRTEKRKVMIVLSDGAPAGGRRSGGHLKSVVRDLPKIGIEAIGIGIMDSNVSRYYDKYAVINRADELPGLVMKEIRQLLTN